MQNISAHITTITAMLCITILEALAIQHGIDGTYFTPIIVVLAGLGGFTLGAIPKINGTPPAE